MKFLGLSKLLESVFNAKPLISRRGIKAKYHFPKPRPATPERKKTPTSGPGVEA